MIDDVDRAEEERLDSLLLKAPMILQHIEGVLSAKIDAELPSTYIKVIGRVKSRKSALDKVKDRKKQPGKQNYTISSITDLIGFRIVCHFQTDIEKIVRLLAELLTEKEVFSDLHEPARLYTTPSPIQRVLVLAISSIFKKKKLPLKVEEKDSRYTSLHLTCILKDYKKTFPPIEIQVRNVFEDAWSSIEHASKYKGRKISTKVSRHLTVLATLVQGCVEYADAIRIDMEDGIVDQSGSVKPLIAYQADLKKFPDKAKRLFARIMEDRKANKHREILEEITRLRVGPDKAILENKEVQYFVDMEEALSHLKLNNLILAQSLYEKLAASYPARAMVQFRLSDTHKLKNEYLDALNCIRKAEALLRKRGGSSETEKTWIKTNLPLKKTYCLWLTGDVSGAHAELSRAYKSLYNELDDELRRKYFSSLIYYALEESLASKKVDQERFKKYVAEMKKLGMDSIDTAVPEEVDTYAWVCHHVGMDDEAKQAISDAINCVQPKTATSNVPVFVHKGNQWTVSLQDFATLYEHMRIIMGAGRNSPPIRKALAKKAI